MSRDAEIMQRLLLTNHRSPSRIPGLLATVAIWVAVAACYYILN